MKRLFFLTVLIGILTACGDGSNKDLLCDDGGIVVGYDDRECNCCSGWLITLDDSGDTIKVLDILLESELLEKVNTSGYPIPVNLEHSPVAGDCSDLYRGVLCFEFR